MILPSGEPLHENLSTSFVNFNQLLSELRVSQFTGYMNLLSWKYDGVVFIDSGHIVNAFEESDGERRNGLFALEGLRARSRDKECALNVHKLDSDLVALLAGSSQRSALYEQLSTDLTSFDHLMIKIQKEEITGHIEIQLTDKSAGTIFVERGQPVASFHRMNGTTTLEEHAHAKFSEGAREGATFSVYRSDPASSFVHDFVKLDLIEIWQELLAAAEKSVDGATTPGTFESAFKRGCLEIVDDYPFLDPFTGGFEFKHGQIHFQGGANTPQFTAGLASAFKALSTKLNLRGVRALQDATQMVALTQRTTLETWGIARSLPNFF